MKNLIKLVLLLKIIIFLPNCRQIAVYTASKEMKTTFDSVMGCTTEEVIIKLGAPQKIDNIGNLQIYHYYKNYGTSSNVFVYDRYGTGSVWQSYDQVEITFKNDRAISWKGCVQR